jgi:hypothetical protein
VRLPRAAALKKNRHPFDTVRRFGERAPPGRIDRVAA